ncbi:thioesterase family protein [Variovorax sp. J22R133]|uniref:thioesterase family protein n=1 Tax=Variovorax brevis TaxID=3053503 RepID=UPI002577873B|nr:thioesterase family protein [Variovorax sp. J22R133]MDM0114102.1 thioesterase family protein [Variovorax sp. J22R133]
MTDTAQSIPAWVYSRKGDAWHPTVHARGPWDPRAQHGGAPAALLVHVAESAVEGPGWQLARLTLELIRPVPLAPLTTRCTVQPARSTARVYIDLYAGETLIAKAHGLMLRQHALNLPAGMPGWSPSQLLPSPGDCKDPLRIAGLPGGTSFYGTAMETRNAQGDPSRPGPGAAWFRLVLPFFEHAPTSPAMRAAAAADFGNGLSWVLPAERYVFTNADLSLHLHRQPVGEWIGLQSETQADASGGGTTRTNLFDEQGVIGVAVQTLVMRERGA